MCSTVCVTGMGQEKHVVLKLLLHMEQMRIMNQKERAKLCRHVCILYAFSCMSCLFFFPTRISVLVGAPKANTSQPGIVEPGAVYYCPWPGPPDSCRQIPFDNSSELRYKAF